MDFEDKDHKNARNNNDKLLDYLRTYTRVSAGVDLAGRAGLVDTQPGKKKSRHFFFFFRVAYVSSGLPLPLTLGAIGLFGVLRK